MGLKNGVAAIENRVFKKIKHSDIIKDTAITLLGIYPWKIETYIHTKLVHECLQ